MRIMYLKLDDGKKIDGWIKAKPLSDTTLKDFINANLRELFKDEVVLDCESKLQAKKVKKRLIQDKYNFQMWDTGSRGIHYHLFFEGMDKLTEEEILLYREEFIKKYNTDMAKKNGFIAMEHRPHIKTGNYKTLVEHISDGRNKIDLDILSKVKRRISIRKALRKPRPLGEHTTTNIKELKRHIKPSDLWRRWGSSQKGNRWDTPFASSKSKACVWLQDDKNFWYDFHIGQGGDIITAVQMKYSCTFGEALNRLKNGDY